jgi:hypothetical protein
MHAPQSHVLFLRPGGFYGTPSRAVPKISTKSLVSIRLPFHKARSLPTHSEATLPPLLISVHFKSRISKIYEKPQGGGPHLQPKNFATRHYPLAAPAYTQQQPQPQSPLCFTS